MSNWRKHKLQERILQLNKKLDFIIKVTEQQVPPLLWHHYFYVYVQHSTVINFPIFQVIIAVIPITFVIGKISYKDKTRIDRHCRNLVLDTEQLLQNFRKRIGSFAQWKQSVNGLMSVGQQRNKSQAAIGRKQHEQRKMLHTLSCWLAKIEHRL